MSVHFLYFLFKSKRVKPTSMSNKSKICRKYVKNKFSNSTSHKKKKKKKKERVKEREGQKHYPTSKTFLKLLKNFHELR